MSDQPAGLGDRGARFWRIVVDSYELGPDELELLVEVCRSLDLCEALAAEPSVETAKELRLQRAELRHQLAALKLPDPTGAHMESGRTRAARAAADARWKDTEDG